MTTRRNEERDPPWRAGLQAARANLVPGAVVQGIMLALLLTYFFLPSARPAFEFLAELKAGWGYAYSALAATIAGALIPEILRVLAFQRGRATGDNLRNLFFTVPFWGTMGMVVDFLYRQQAAWFGTELSLEVILPKVLVDQFLWNPIIAAPLMVSLYHWKNSGYSRSAWREIFHPEFYREEIFPVLIATWGVWIPIVSITYSLPVLLQIPLFSIALSLWVMLYTWISESAAARRQGEFPASSESAIDES